MRSRKVSKHAKAWIFSLRDNDTDTPAITLNWFIGYKFFNSLFLGVSIGSVFVLYTPLSPAIFSAGGIGLAIGTLMVATQYHRLFNTRSFFILSLSVECVILLGIMGVLIFPVDTTLALFIYIGYQFTFALGSYLVRCETLLIVEEKALTHLDIAKKSGYLVGMGAAWGFYEGLHRVYGVTDKVIQVQAIHWPLLAIEAGIILLLFMAFKSVWHPSGGAPSES